MASLAEEDYAEEGHLDLYKLKEIITGEYQISHQLVDYILYYVYVRSNSAAEMKYSYISEMLSQVGSPKKVRPETASPSKLKERNIVSKGTFKGLKALDDSSEEESEKYSIPEDVETRSEKILSDKKENLFLEDLESTPSELKLVPQESETEIDEEAMIDIAEKIFEKMAEHMITTKVTVRSTFKDYIFEKKIDSEHIELISRKGFIKGVKKLKINELEDVEMTCLLRMLSKDELEGAIMLDDLL